MLCSLCVAREQLEFVDWSAVNIMKVILRY